MAVSHWRFIHQANRLQSRCGDSPSEQRTGRGAMHDSGQGAMHESARAQPHTGHVSRENAKDRVIE